MLCILLGRNSNAQGLLYEGILGNGAAGENPCKTQGVWMDL